MIAWITHWLRNNGTSLVLAIALSLLVWVVATLEENPFLTGPLEGNIPIDIVGLDESKYMITNAYTETTRLDVRAPEDIWSSLSANDVLVTADLSGLEPGTHQILLDIDTSAVPQMALMAANPDRIRVEIEERSEREFPVQLALDGQPAIGYDIEGTTLTPETVVVRGPRSQVDLVSEVRASITVEGRRDSIRTEVNLVALDNEGGVINNVTITPDASAAEVAIDQVAGYKYISIIPRTTGQVQTGYYVSNVTVTPAQIVVQGDPTVLETMQPFIETFIDVDGLTDDIIVEVGLTLPPGVTPIDEGTIEALVSVAAQPGSRALLAPIEIVGLPEELAADLIPEELEVILSGPLPLLDSLDIETDIRVRVDLAGLSIGTYQIEPDIEVVNEELSIESFFPTLIEVTIQTATSTPSR